MLSQEVLLSNGLAKWDRIKRGERVVVSHQSLDALCDHFKDQDGPEASCFFGCLRSIPNPQQVGTLDALVAWVDNSALLEYGFNA